MKSSHTEDVTSELPSVRHQAFVQLQNTCALCNSALTIKVQNYACDLRLREEASCPQCRILARVKDHHWH